MKKKTFFVLLGCMLLAGVPLITRAGPRPVSNRG